MPIRAKCLTAKLNNSNRLALSAHRISAANPFKWALSECPPCNRLWFSQRHPEEMIIGFSIWSRIPWSFSTSFGLIASKPHPHLHANSFFEKFLVRSPINKRRKAGDKNCPPHRKDSSLARETGKVLYQDQLIKMILRVRFRVARLFNGHQFKSKETGLNDCLYKIKNNEGSISLTH